MNTTFQKYCRKRLREPVLIAIAFSCLVTFFSCPATGQLQPIEESFLLLKNGGLMRGQISRTNSGFEVVSSRGSRYRMPAEQVTGFYQSIQQVFGRKFLIAKKRNRLDAYRELVYWCVEEDLLDEADLVIRHVHGSPLRGHSVASRHEQVKRLNDYVTTTRQRLARREVQKNSLQPATVSGPAQPANTQTRSNANPVKTVSWNSDVDSSNPLQPRHAKKYLPSLDAIEAATKDMPRNTNRLFRSLQTKMATGCMAAQCHSNETDSFQLIHTRRGQKVGWRTTQKNLYFALQFVDRKDPDQSILLKKMSTRHATQSQATFPVDSEVYRTMRAWIYQVTENERLYHIRMLEEARKKQAEQNVSQKADPNEAVDPLTLNPPDPADLYKQEKQLAKDPFDPEIFNRKHHPDRVKSGTTGKK